MFDTVVASIGDIDELVRKSEMVLRDVAEPYYDANSNLDVLERKLNSEEVVLRDALDPISRSYRGLIAARLVGRDLDELEERYRHLVHRYAKGTVDADFSRFVDGLRSMDNLGFVGAR